MTSNATNNATSNGSSIKGSEEEDTRRKQDFLDSSQYNLKGIKRYEWVFGPTFLSTGGRETTDMVLQQVQLPAHARILDVGSGIGGHSFLMAERFPGASVHGVDLSRNMLAVAEEHLSRRPHLRSSVRFEWTDMTKEQPAMPDNHYDLVYSRDCFMHIEDKFALMRRLFTKLRPGGRVLFTDYVSGDGPQEPEYAAYLKQRQYFPATVDKYRKVLQTSGFVAVDCADWTHVFRAALEAELLRLQQGRQQFLQRFSLQDLHDLESGWRQKLVRVQNRNQAWMLATAVKPLA